MRIAGELLSAPRYSELKWLVSLILADCATLNEMDAHTYLSKYIKAEEFLKDKDFFRPVFQNPIEKDLPIPFDYLLLLNEKLGWDLPYPVANWSMAFDLTDTKPEPGEPASHFKFQHGPFQTAGIGLGDLFSLGISMLDPEVQKIYRTIERADGYGLGTQYELLIGLPSIYLPGPFSDRSAELAACKQVETEVAK